MLLLYNYMYYISFYMIFMVKNEIKVNINVNNEYVKN